MWRFGFTSAFMMAVLGLLAPNAHAEIKYTLTDLTAQAGDYNIAGSINNSGDVVGFAGTKTSYHAFLYHDDLITDLHVPNSTSSVAAAINSSGQIAVNASQPNSRSYLLSNGTFTDLGGFGGTIRASDINDLGQVVGTATTPSSSGAFLYSGGQLKFLDLSSLGASTSLAEGINNKSQIVGQYFLPDPSGTGVVPPHGFLYSEGVAQDLGANVLPTAINSTGDIIGTDIAGGVGQGFVLHNGQVSQLGNFQALAINNKGAIVGEGGGGGNHAAIYQNGSFADLNTLIAANSGLTLFQALGINDLGQIVGSAFTASGDEHAFLLNPTVPEPAGLSGILLSALLLRRRRAA